MNNQKELKSFEKDLENLLKKYNYGMRPVPYIVDGKIDARIDVFVLKNEKLEE